MKYPIVDSLVIDYSNIITQFFTKETEEKYENEKLRKITLQLRKITEANIVKELDLYSKIKRSETCAT